MKKIEKQCCLEPVGNDPLDRRWGYGQAIGGVYIYEDQTMWVDNGEYGSQVNYCPFCGRKAEVGIGGT